MKKKTKIIISVVVCAVIIVTGIFLIPRIVTYFVFTYPRIIHHDVRKLELSNVKEIQIVHDGETKDLNVDSQEYNNVIDIFDSKRVKIRDDKPYLWLDDSYEITIVTDDETYTLHGVPELDNSNTPGASIDFVVYDYTSEGSDYLYQIVTIPEKDFNLLFNE